MKGSRNHNLDYDHESCEPPHMYPYVALKCTMPGGKYHHHMIVVSATLICILKLYIYLLQLDSVGDISTCTFTGNTAVTGQAVYSFDCVSTLSSNGYENEPFNALFLDKSAAFKPSVLING